MAYQGDERNHLKVLVEAFIALGVSCESSHARTDDLLNRNPQGKRRTGIGWS